MKNTIFALDMRTEEQLEMAYITIAQLRDQNTKLIDMITSLEKRITASDAKERQVMENFYKGLMEDLRMAHEKEMGRLQASMLAMQKANENLTSKISEFTTKIAMSEAAANSGRSKERAARADKYGPKSERMNRLGKRQDRNDREEERDNFDGTAGSEKSTNPPMSQEETDTIKAMQNKIRRTHPGAELKMERIDYSKAKAYTDSPKYHKLGEYYTLSEGSEFVRRNGEIDINYVKVIIRHPETYEEHIYETATVRSKDTDDIRTVDTVDGIDRPIKGCCFGTSTLAYILMEKFWYNTPFDQIVRKLRINGVNMPKTTLGDNIHRAIEYMREKMSAWWQKALYDTDYWMLDETPGLVGCENGDGTRSYRKKYFWTITARKLGLTWLTYEHGSRGKEAVAHYMDKFIGFYTTDGYACYKIWDCPDEGEKGETNNPNRKRSACLVHIRRPLVKALGENFNAALWFIDLISMIFSKEYSFKTQGLKGFDRWIARRKPGSEGSALNNAFMFSLIESCRWNKLDPGKYIKYLLGKLKHTREDENLTRHLPCYCGAL